MSLDLFDTHCHLDAEAYKEDLPAILERAKKAGVSRIVTIGAGYGVGSAKAAVRIAESSPTIWASVGIHPCDAAANASLEELKALALHPKVVAIGETGLDFHYPDADSPRDKQDLWFRNQIKLAREVKKPLIIHCREAGPECLQTLQEEHAEEVGGVFHCYAQDAEFAASLRKINFMVSFPGILTFKKSQGMRNVAKAIPLSQIMLETDGPFLAPEPYRGKRCESAFMVETAKILASVHGVTLEEVARVTTMNALQFYKINQDNR